MRAFDKVHIPGVDSSDSMEAVLWYVLTGTMLHPRIVNVSALVIAALAMVVLAGDFFQCIEVICTR